MPRPRVYTDTERLVALDLLQALLRSPDLRLAGEAHIKKAARLARVEVAALRQWAREIAPSVPGGEAQRPLPALPRLLSSDTLRPLPVPVTPDTLTPGGEGEEDAGIGPDVAGRPRPPGYLADDGRFPKRVEPAPDLAAWIRAAFLTEGGALYNDDHWHLSVASIGCLWTNVPYQRQMRTVAAWAEIPLASGGNAWAKARETQQLLEWFGEVPDFLLLFDAVLGDAASDRTFCARVEHELYHCSYRLDAFGAPKFDRTTGLPVFALRGHDVEEFVGVWRRWGPASAAGRSRELAEAAQLHPVVTDPEIDLACGLCLQS